MTTFERRQRTLELLRQQPGIRVPEIAAALDVSAGTVRNDLTYLEQAGALDRVRGGAVVRREVALEESSDEIPNQPLKQLIARWAADMVDEGDSILLDASSTVRSLASALRRLRNLTVITHSIETALEVAKNPMHTVILLGGVLRGDGKRVLGHLGETNLERLHVKTLFLSCDGFSVEAGLTESDYAEAQLKRRMIASADRVVALVDSSKFGHVDLTPFATVEQIDRIFTDNELDPKYIAQLQRTCTVVTVCDRESVTTFSPCGGDRPGGRSGNDRNYRIGFANLTETASPFAVDVRRGLERAVKEAGNIDLVLADNQLNGEIALRTADELLAHDIDLVIEYQIDESVGGLLMEKFHRADVPVIAVDIPMVGATFFGMNNYQVGHLAGRGLGEWIRDHWGGAVSHVLVLEEPRAGALVSARIRGQLDGLQQCIGEVPETALIRVDSGNTSDASEARSREALSKLKRWDRLAVISFNDDAAIGAIRAIRRLGREKHAVVVGQGCDRLAREEMRRPDSLLMGATAFMPERYGARLLQLAQRILTKEPVPPAVYGDHVFVTPQNLGQHYPGEAEQMLHMHRAQEGN